jgi:hypothetical protein
MLPTMSVPPPSTMQAPAQPGGAPISVTRQQQDYLDALKAAGIEPSSELLALSIGSYVCQARAAKQSEQAVRDYVTPLVRTDVGNTKLNAVGPPPSEVDAATADYIRIATERLC